MKKSSHMVALSIRHFGWTAFFWFSNIISFVTAWDQTFHSWSEALPGSWLWSCLGLGVWEGSLIWASPNLAGCWAALLEQMDWERDILQGSSLEVSVYLYPAPFYLHMNMLFTFTKHMACHKLLHPEPSALDIKKLLNKPGKETFEKAE